MTEVTELTGLTGAENPWGRILNSGLGGQVKGYALAIDHYQDAPRWLPKWMQTPKAVWEFKLDAGAPLTFVLPDGTEIEPDKHFLTDLGSIPTPVQVWIPKDDCLAYMLHDSGYRDGGLWVREPGQTWEFRHMGRDEVDTLLWRFYMAQWWADPDTNPCYAAKARAIYAAVRAVSWVPWARYRKSDQ